MVSSKARGVGPGSYAGRVDPGPERHHGFDLLRIVAALGVVLTHSFSTTGFNADKPLVGIGERDLGVGSLGVATFFVISGFLVTESWQRTGGAVPFLLRRAGRIVPGLLLMVVLTTFVVGPLATELDLGAYLTDPATWRFAGRNSTLVTGVSFALPSVFTGNPGQSVNSSLWTLPYEVWCYLGLTLVGVLGGLRRRLVLLALFAVSWSLHVFATAGDDPWLSATGHGLSARKGAELATFFLGGAVLALWRAEIDRRWLLAGGAAIALAAMPLGGWGLFVLAIPVLVVGLGTTSGPISRATGRWGDPSYGLYILSYPAQQVLVATGAVSTPWAMFALSAPIGLALGYASWHLVEHPVLRRLRGRRARPGAADVEVGSGATAEIRP